MSAPPRLPPAVCFVGDSGVGKTTLIAGVLRELAATGVRAAAVKHSKAFDDPDPPHKDSARLRAAGAVRVVLASPARTVVFEDHAEPPPFERLWELAAPADLVLVESFGAARLPAIEVLRAALPRRTPRLLGDPRWLAVVSDFIPEGTPAAVARFGLEDAAAVARFLGERFLPR